MTGLEFNVRLMNKFNQSGGQWRIDPDSPNFAQRVEAAKQELALFKREEPTSEWRLESYGMSNGWHVWKD